MIVKNEEGTLGRCLDSVGGIPDEIIIVDTGSGDRTREVAARYTNRIYDFGWIDDFSAARNFAFSKATCEYWMWLDADDVLLEEDRQALQTFKTNAAPDFDMAFFKYHAAFDETGAPTFSYYRERLIRRGPLPPWNGAVHEAITPFGQMLHLDIAVTHRKDRPLDKDRNLRIYENQLAKGAVFSSRDMYYHARELYYHARYEEAANSLAGFIAREDAWLENKIEACQIRAHCLYALHREAEALGSLLQSFAWERPRAEICCEIGEHFFSRGRFDLAAHWYEQALHDNQSGQTDGFRTPDCRGYIPLLQLCVCAYRRGDIQAARAYNERAALIKPRDEAVLRNREFFAAFTTDEKDR